MGWIPEIRPITLLYAGVFASSLMCSLGITPYVRRFAKSRGRLPVPSTERHLRTLQIPRLGGIAIFVAFLVGMSVVLLRNWLFPPRILEIHLPTLFTILLAALVVFILGVCDDILDIGVPTKFTVQTLAATILFLGGIQVKALPLFFGHRQLHGSFSFLLDALWVLAITNAFNLIDGIDGLAAGSALSSSIIVCIAALLNENVLVSVMSVAFSGALLGFLRSNFNPATIFMGDSGSLFVGFMLSALALSGAQKAPTIIAIAVPMVSFGLPIVETGLSVLRRWISGQPLFKADHEHIHHILLARGFSQREVVILLYVVSAVFGLCSLFLFSPREGVVATVLAVLGAGICIGVNHLGYPEMKEVRRVAQRALEQHQIFANDMAIRRAIEKLRKVSEYQDVCDVLVTAFRKNDFDGLELEIRCDGPRSREVQATHRIPEAGWRFSWKKPGIDCGIEHARWSLSLNLFEMQDCSASLVLYRFSADRDLQIDVNVLTADFPGALAQALMQSLFKPNGIEFVGQSELIPKTLSRQEDREPSALQISAQVKNFAIFSVDVEDWFHILEVPSSPDFKQWDTVPSRIEKNFRHLLDLFSQKNVHTTCFFLGWIAERFPHLVKEAASQGHEIGSHGYAHRLVHTMTPKQFYTDVMRSRQLLEDITGNAILGHRAAGFSLNEKAPWFFDTLMEAGYCYDASLFPAKRAHGGVRNGHRRPYLIRRGNSEIVELPMTVAEVLGKPMCFFGGGYLRLFPYSLIRKMAHGVLAEGRPLIFYVHPREIDPEQPRMRMNLKRQFKSYVNLTTTERKLAQIFDDFSVTSFSHFLFAIRCRMIPTSQAITSRAHSKYDRPQLDSSA